METNQISIKFKLLGSEKKVLALKSSALAKDLDNAISELKVREGLNSLISYNSARVNFLTSAESKGDFGDILKIIIDILLNKAKKKGITDLAVRFEISKMLENGVVKSLSGEVKDASVESLKDLLKEL